MSIQKRRNSLFKSSISIRSIGDALQSFSDGLVAARRNSDKSIKTIRQRNIFKRNSIRNDNKYFRQRQENIKRKAREDELEASSVQGVPKTQGNILTKSTRGFLGRMLDFIGILIIGWAITNLPKIINAIQGLIKRISSVTGILSLFVDGIKFVLTGIGTVIKGAISNLLRFDFLKTKTDVEQGLEGANTGIFQARSELELAGQQFADSETFGLPDPPAFETDKPQRVRDSENNEEKKAVLQNEGTEAEVEQKSKNIDKIIETGLGRLSIPECQFEVGQRFRVRILSDDVSITLSKSKDSSISNIFKVKVKKIATDSKHMKIITLESGSTQIKARITKKSSEILNLELNDEVFAQIKTVAITY